jgi:Ca2+-binding EF-hand superfamily protein
MMLLRILLLTVAPTTPGWVNTCRETLDYRIGNVFKTPEMKEMEKIAQQAYLEGLNEFRTSIRNQLRADRDQMRELFEQIDVDKSGTISRRELVLFYKVLQRNYGLSAAEVDALDAIDDEIESKSTEAAEVTFDDMILWMQEERIWDPEKVEKDRALVAQGAMDAFAGLGQNAAVFETEDAALSKIGNKFLSKRKTVTQTGTGLEKGASGDMSPPREAGQIMSMENMTEDEIFAELEGDGDAT